MIGYAIQIIRKDGSAFFATPAVGFATPCWYSAAPAREEARALRAHKLKCRVVRVDYSDPVLAPRKPQRERTS